MIKRNGDMVVPNGSTVIKQGDILVVSDQSHIDEKKKKDKHSGDEPDKKPDKAEENNECDEKEGEKVSV